MMELPGSLLKTLQACRTLPSAPAVVLQVLELSHDPDIGTAAITKVIARDPALTAKILKVANSPWCGVRWEVTTLDRAVNLLGIKGTMSLALTFSLVRELQTTKGARFDHQGYWRRSAIAATATRAFGASVDAAGPDKLFLAGLLQDIGMLVLNEAMPAIYGPLVASAHNDHYALVEMERYRFKADHAQVGSWLLQKWCLPDVLLAAVAGSHDPADANEADSKLAKSVALGSRTAEIWVNPDTKGSTSAARAAAESLLEIPGDLFEKLLGDVAVNLVEVTTDLEVDIGGEVFINRLLDQAREAITELNLRALQEAQQLEIQAQRDELTSLYNRTYMNQRLGQLFDLSHQQDQSLSVIFLDVDNFKVINDTHGHYGGDSVLVSVARVIQSAARGSDIVVRLSGDEFVVIVSNSSDHIGSTVAERIRAAIEEKSHCAGDGKWAQVTVSIGCATMSPNRPFSSPKELLEAADRSLYIAKTGGRNRVALAS